MELATSVIVGNLLGANNPMEAKRRARYVFAICSLVLVSFCSVLFIFRYEIGGLYTDLEPTI